MDDFAKTAQYWSQVDEAAFSAEHYWATLPAVRRRLNRLASGSEECHWVDHCLETYFLGRLPLPRCLSLGCGAGWLERTLAHRGAFQQCEALDIAPGSILQAQDEARKEGLAISYEVADLNTASLPPAAYDAVWMSNSYHHVVEVERLACQVAQSLKPDGFVLLNEYIGPTRFQFPPAQRKMIQQALQLLPARYRRLGQYAQHCEQERAHRVLRNPAWALSRLCDKIQDRDLLPALQRKARTILHPISVYLRKDREVLKERVDLPTIHDVVAVDPSEAIRSDQIVLALRKHMRIVELKPLGGNLLHFLLDGIAHNFPDDDPTAQSWLQALFALEDAFLAEGSCTSDFALVVACRKDSQFRHG